MTIKENLEELDRKITEAAAKSGRKREDITLVAVSKTVGPCRSSRSIPLRTADFCREPCTVPDGQACWHGTIFSE